jgi:hypothetical protein
MKHWMLGDRARLAIFSAIAAAAVLIGILIGRSPLMRPLETPLPKPSTLAMSPAPTEPAGWQEPRDYDFVISLLCGEPNFMGNLMVKVRHGEIAEVEPQDPDYDSVPLPSPPEQVPTLGDLLRLAQRAGADDGAKVTFTADPHDGHPIEIVIDWNRDAIGGEECYEVDSYSAVSPRATVYVRWTEIRLPDPVPDVFGGATPFDLVAFGGGYVAVGGLKAYCDSDITVTPATCRDTSAGLPSNPSAAVWLSDDGRNWKALPYQDSFLNSCMTRVATDGRHIVATGSRGRGPCWQRRHPVMWTSDDGRTWELIHEGPLPEFIVATSDGFVGARTVADAPQFLQSIDGRYWHVLTEAGELGTGLVSDVAVSLDGLTVVGVGANGSAVIHRRAAGGWERAPGQPFPGMHGRSVPTVTATPSGWVVVGTSAEPAYSYDPGAWTSEDGVHWTLVPAESSPRGADAEIGDVAWTGDGLVAIGTVSGEHGTQPAVWFSTDGTSWYSIPDQSAFPAGATMNGLAISDGAVLAVGGALNLIAYDHDSPLVWLALP